jgi:hypothetical protein
MIKLKKSAPEDALNLPAVIMFTATLTALTAIIKTVMTSRTFTTFYITFETTSWASTTTL